MIHRQLDIAGHGGGSLGGKGEDGDKGEKGRRSSLSLYFFFLYLIGDNWSGGCVFWM